MSAALAVLLVASAAACACAPVAPARHAAPAGLSAAAAAPAPGACRGAPDSDDDGLRDACELALAGAFAPVLLQDPADCAWDGNRIQAGYLHVVEPLSDRRVRIGYLPAYVVDCGWRGPKCLLPLVDCEPHAADSEAIFVDVEYDDGWRPTGVFLSAHCFDGDAPDCRWYGGSDLATIDWSATHPVVWVARGRHANYPSARACDEGHGFFDTCDFASVALPFPVAPERNVGSAAAPACAGPPSGPVRLDPASLECVWTREEFGGWSGRPTGVTGYRRYFAEVARFALPSPDGRRGDARRGESECEG